MNAVAAKLREARALIKRGWVQGNYSKRKGGVTCYCSLGAISKAATYTPAYDVVEHKPYVREATEVLQRVIEASSPYRVVDWNDEPERTHAEVLAAFDKAIELAEVQP